MDALFQTQSNELSTTTQKEKLFKDAERQWNTLSTEKGAPGRKAVSYTHLRAHET